MSGNVTNTITHKNVSAFVGVFVLGFILSANAAAEISSQVTLQNTTPNTITDTAHDKNIHTKTISSSTTTPNDLALDTSLNAISSALDTAFDPDTDTDAHTDNHTDTNQVNDNTYDTKIDAQTLITLAKHKQWQHLLFYQDGKAEVISKDFYLTDPTASRHRPNFDPYDELLATLQAKDDKDTVCRYPARYFWLNTHLPTLKADLSACTDLPSPTQDISLILIGSYLKNPASTFGHVLVGTKNNDSSHAQLSGQDLLNESYNFGASIPNNENGVMYALKGLFGFYHAGFATADFYRQDTAYAKNEQRDMWEYTLNLGEFDKTLLNYHLHEAKRARFTYYFIKQNCGYRSGEILELVSDMPMTNRLGGWYAPDFIFNQLTEYKNGELIANVRYLPSEQTALRQRFKTLSQNLQNAINHAITTKNLQSIHALEPQDKALALDFLLAHSNYKLSQANKKETQSLEQFKKRLITERIVLPSGNAYEALPITPKPSPALSNKTTLSQVGIDNHGLYAGGSMFIKDSLNTHTDLDKRFEAVNLTAKYDFDDNKVHLQNFTLLHIQQIENLGQALADEPWLSWQLKTGLRHDPFDKQSHRIYAQAGVGVGAFMTDDWLVYGLGNAVLHDDNGYVDGVVELGVRYKNAKDSRRAVEVNYQNHHRTNQKPLHTLGMTLRQEINKNNDIRLNLTHERMDNDTKSHVGVSWQHYW